MLPSFYGYAPGLPFRLPTGMDPVPLLLHRRDSAVPEYHQIFSRWRDQRVFLSDNLPVPEELSHDWFFRQ